MRIQSTSVHTARSAAYDVSRKKCTMESSMLPILDIQQLTVSILVDDIIIVMYDDNLCQRAEKNYFLAASALRDATHYYYSITTIRSATKESLPMTTGGGGCSRIPTPRQLRLYVPRTLHTRL